MVTNEQDEKTYPLPTSDTEPNPTEQQVVGEGVSPLDVGQGSEEESTASEGAPVTDVKEITPISANASTNDTTTQPQSVGHYVPSVITDEGLPLVQFSDTEEKGSPTSQDSEQPTEETSTETPTETPTEEVVEQANVTTDREPEAPSGNYTPSTDSEETISSDAETEDVSEEEGEESEESEGSDNEKAPLPLSEEDIPNDPSQWEQLMKDHPELAESVYDYFTNLEDERKKDKKKEDRAALGRAFGNMMRAFGNLPYAGKGGLSTYNSEEGQKAVDAVHDRYEKARKARNDNYTQMWNFLQNLRTQNLKESAQKHKERIDNINAQIKQAKADAEAEINYWKAQYQQGLATYQEYKTEEQRIKADNAQELQDLEKERKKAQTSASNASAKKSVQQGNAAEKNAESNAKKAAADAELKNTEANILKNGGNVNLGGLYDNQ